PPDMQLAKDRRNPGIREQNVPDRNSPPPGLPAPTPQERQIQSASRHFESVALGSRALAASRCSRNKWANRRRLRPPSWAISCTLGISDRRANSLRAYCTTAFNWARSFRRSKSTASSNLNFSAGRVAVSNQSRKVLTIEPQIKSSDTS